MKFYNDIQVSCNTIAGTKFLLCTTILKQVNMKTQRGNIVLGSILLMATVLIASSFILISKDMNVSPPSNTRLNISDKEADAKFLVDAAQISLAEVELGKLAQQNSKTTDVVDLGKMMVTDHTSALKSVNALAKSKNVAVPAACTLEAQDEYKKLSQKTGKDFDKEYCRMMISGHKDAISLYEKASVDSDDAEIRAWAKSTLPTLRKHLEHTESCQQKCDKMK